MATIPAMHVSTVSKAEGEATVYIQSRQEGVNSGVFTVKMSVSFNPPGDAYPNGTLIINCDLYESLAGTYKATSIELVNSHGKHNPTIYLTGRCKSSNAAAPQGLRYWVMVANNKSSTAPGTPDVVGFVINDNMGNRVAYGTGPVKSGDIFVSPA